jgi:signal transduction histidine kinase/CheY-like chemotaxis protein
MCKDYRILIVDDESRAREKIADLLRRAPEPLGKDLRIAEAATVRDAKQALLNEGEGGFDLVILDWLMDDANVGAAAENTGDALLRWMQGEGAGIDTDAIVFTGRGSEQIEAGVVSLGAYHYADKPEVIRDANERQADGTIGGPHSRGFLFHVRNCVQHRRVRWRREQIIRVLQQLHRQLGGIRHFEERLEAVVTCAVKLNPRVAKATIRVRRPDGHQRVALWGGAGEVEIASGFLGQGEGIAGRVFQTGEPYNCKDVSRDPYFVRTWARTQSELCVPIFGWEVPAGGGSNVVAVINVESTETDSFCTEDETAFRMLAEVASLTIQDMQLLSDVFEMAAEINSAVHPVAAGGRAGPQQDEFLDALANVKLEQLQPLFQRLLDDALRLTNAKYGVVFMIDRTRRVLRQVFEHGMGEQCRKKMTDIPLDAEQTIVAEVYRQGKAILATGSRDREKPLWGRYEPFFDDNQVGSFLCVPMLLGRTVAGVIDVESQEPLAFSPLEAQVVEAFGRMAASALANLALMVSIQARNVEETKAALVSMAVHEAARPLNHVALAIERCELLCEESRFDELGGCLGEAGKTVKEASQDVRKAIELAAKVDIVSSESVDLQALLYGVVWQARAGTHGFSIEWADAPNGVTLVRVNSHGLKLVLRELIENARKVCLRAGKTDGAVRISTESSDDRVIVFFADNGPGVPPEEVDRIFEPPKDPAKGGFGLHKCKAMMELHDGALSLDSNSAEGATFRLCLLKIRQ